MCASQKNMDNIAALIDFANLIYEEPKRLPYGKRRLAAKPPRNSSPLVDADQA
jgi:hypothetical protein